MAQSRVWIEEIGPGRWVAEVEGGGASAVRKQVTGATFDEIILAVIETHAAMTPAPVLRPVKDVLADQAAREDATKAAAVEAEDAANEAQAAAGRVAHAEFEQSQAAAESERRVAAEAERVERTGEAVAPVASNQRNDMIAQAEALGLAIDRRWGDARLREVLDAERARRA